MTVVSVRMPLELYADARRLADGRRQSLSEVIRDSLERELAVEITDWRIATSVEDREWREWREQHDHPRRWAEARWRERMAAVADERDVQLEAMAPPPTVVAAVRAAEIRRRQKARKR